MNNKGQTKICSIVEIFFNTMIGFVISLLAQLYIFPMYNIQINRHEDFQIALIFTIISVIRGYFMRRIFNFINN